MHVARCGWIVSLPVVIGTCCCATLAQEVRPRGSPIGYAGRIRSIGEDAQAQGRADWPDVLEGDVGTQVYISFDVRNADVTLVTNKQATLLALLREARRVVSDLGRQKADFITHEGRRSVCVDIELNDYLVTRGLRTQFELNLGLLAKSLRSSQVLPKPIVLAIESRSAEATLQQKTSRSTLTGKTAFIGLSEITNDAWLYYAEEIPQASYPAAAVLCIFFAVVLVSSIRLPWKLIQWHLAIAGDKDSSPDEVQTPRTADEVQTEYRKMPPLWLILVTMAVISAVPVLLISGSERIIRGALYLLPIPRGPETIQVFTVLFLGPLVASSVVAIAKNLQALRTRAQGSPHGALTFPIASLGVLIALPTVVFFLMALPSFPGFDRLDTFWRRVIFYTAMFGPLFLLAIAWRKSAAAYRTELGPDDPVREEIVKLANEAGVRVKSVHLIRSHVPNAYAGLSGVVGLTEGLLARLEPAEVRAIIAHELGHLKLCHTRQQFIVSISAIAAVVAVWTVAKNSLDTVLSKPLRDALRSPGIGFFILPLVLSLILGPMRRRHEIQADAFAASLLGDTDVVVRALSRVHTLAEEPHELKRSDEAISSHPSLVRRVAALQRAAREPVQAPE